MKFSPPENYARFSAPVGNYALSRQANSITVSAWYCWMVSAVGDTSLDGWANAISPKCVALRDVYFELSRDFNPGWLSVSTRYDLSYCPSDIINVDMLSDTYNLRMWFEQFYDKQFISQRFHHFVSVSYSRFYHIDFQLIFAFNRSKVVR